MMRKLILVAMTAVAVVSCTGDGSRNPASGNNSASGASGATADSPSLTPPPDPGTGNRAVPPGSGDRPAADASPSANPGPTGAPAGNPSGTTGNQPSSADDSGTRLTEAEQHENVREVTIPAGTILPLRLQESLGSDTSHVEQAVLAAVTRPVVVRGHSVVPAGSEVHGTVIEAQRAGRVKGRAELRVRFDGLVLKGDRERYPIRTGLLTRRARATKGDDAKKIGIPAAGGAVIGAIIGGKKGALVGGTVGAGGGTAVVLSTRGREVRLPRGSIISVKLLEPVTVRIAS